MSFIKNVFQKLNKTVLNVANLLSIMRILVSASLFFFFQNYPLILLFLYLILLLSDFLDGYLARKLHIVSPIGALLDPFSDIIMNFSYFFILMLANIVPEYFVLLFIYREISMLFLRMLAVMKGTIISANILGKLKTSAYYMFILWGLSQYFIYQQNLGFIYLGKVLLWGSLFLAYFSFFIYFLKFAKSSHIFDHIKNKILKLN